MEVSLYDGQPFPFTTEWYTTREHAPHLEQQVHQPRMQAVARLAVEAIDAYGFASVVDLGAGDGGMLSLITSYKHGAIEAWGYDLMQVNCDYARDVRVMDVRYKDFVDEPIDWAELVIITEVLEHLENPHDMVRRIGEHAEAIIASSPAKETAEFHDGCHAWCWDMDGYARLVERGGFVVTEHLLIDGEFEFQILLGIKP